MSSGDRGVACARQEGGEGRVRGRGPGPWGTAPASRCTPGRARWPAGMEGGSRARASGPDCEGQAKQGAGARARGSRPPRPSPIPEHPGGRHTGPQGFGLRGPLCRAGAGPGLQGSCQHREGPWDSDSGPGSARGPRSPELPPPAGPQAGPDRTSVKNQGPTFTPGQGFCRPRGFRGGAPAAPTAMPPRPAAC